MKLSKTILFHSEEHLKSHQHTGGSICEQFFFILTLLVKSTDFHMIFPEILG